MPTKTKLTHEMLNAMPLWELLSIGMRDLKKHERAKGCVVDMNELVYNSGRYCHACMAGAVLHHSFGVDEHDGEAAEKWIYALDWLRVGFVEDAIHFLGRRQTGTRRAITLYEDSPTGFWRDIRKLKRDLKAAGI